MNQENNQNLQNRLNQHTEDEIETLTQTEPKKSKALLITAILISFLIIFLGVAYYLFIFSKPQVKLNNIKDNSQSKEQSNVIIPGQVSTTKPTPIIKPAVNKPKIVPSSTFSNSDLPKNYTLDKKTAIDFDKDGQDEVVAWVKNQNKSGKMTFCGPGSPPDCQYHPKSLMVFKYSQSEGKWALDYDYDNANLSSYSGVGMYKGIPTDSYEIFTYDEKVMHEEDRNYLIITLRIGGGSGVDIEWLALTKNVSGYTVTRPTAYPDTSLRTKGTPDKLSVSVTSKIEIKNNQVIEYKSIYKDDDAHMAPTGGTLIYTWQPDGTIFKLMSQDYGKEITSRETKIISS